MKSSTVTFGELVRKVNDRVDPVEDGLTRFVAGEHMDTDDLVIRRYGNVGDGYLGPAFHMRFKPGHILYGSRRTYLRKVSMAHFDGVCSNTTFVLEPQNETLSSKYLLYLMSTERFHQNSIALSKGSTNPYINFSDLANFEFVLPSLEEQTRVVELLSAVDEHAEALRHQLNVAIETRKSVLQNLLGRGGKGWTETTLGEAALVLMGQSPPGDSYNSAGLGLPFMQGSAEFGEHVPTPTLWCSEPAKIAEPGDLLISVRAPVGDTNFANQPIAIGRGLAIVRSNGIASTEFLRMTIQLGVEKLLAVSGGGMFSSITAKNLRSFAVSAPSLDEQERIVEEITKIDVLIEETSAALNSTKQLRTSLLNKEIA